MPLVFKTNPDSPDRVDIVGAGTLFPFGKGGVVVADAALVMAELQEKNPDGSVKTDDEGQPVPLSGPKLTAAAKDFAEQRGFTTVNLNEDAISNLPQEAGLPADRPPMAECGHADYLAMYGEDGLETVNNDPEVLVTSGAVAAGVPVAAPATEGNSEPGSEASGSTTTTKKEG